MIGNTTSASDRCLRALPTQPNRQTTPSTRRLKISRQVLSDGKLWLQQSVRLCRLSPTVIRTYDKNSYKRYYKQFVEQKNFNKYSKLFHNFHTKRQTTSTATHSTARTTTSATTGATNESPKRMRLWDCPKSPTPQYLLPQNSFRTLRSHSQDLRQWTKCDERENSLMSISEYNRYLDLISVRQLNRLDAKQLNTQFGLRNIAKTDGYSMNPSNQVLLNPDFLINNLVTDCRKVQNSSDGLKRRRVKVLTANKIKDKYKKLEKHKKRVIKEWKNQYINSLTIYPFSSPMGQRVADSLKSECFDKLKVESMVRKYEIYCSLKIRHREKAENKLNKWKPRNIERLTTGLELSQRSHAMGFHQYSFTRRQRLEKLKRTETGIDWKSRITAFTCNPNVQVMVPKLYWCPICSKTIQVDHSCDMSAKCDMNSSKVPILNLSSNGLSQQMVLRGDNKRRNDENLAQNAHEICHKKHKKLSPKKSPKVCRIDLNEED